MSSNQLLTALPLEEYQRLLPHLENIELTQGQILYQPNEIIEYVYFPDRALISLVCIMEDGSITEVGLIGNDGILGLAVFWGGKYNNNTAIVQIGGVAMRLRGDIFLKECDRGGKLPKLLLLYTQALFTQVSQTAACNRIHSIQQRLARWLLSAQDCANSDLLLLTQDFISNMLGVRRPSVTEAANMLQQIGAIRYFRGEITILDRQILLTHTCECYGVVQREYTRLLGSKNI